MIYIIHPLEKYYNTLCYPETMTKENATINFMLSNPSGPGYRYLCWLFNEALTAERLEWTWNWRHNA